MNKYRKATLAVVLMMTMVFATGCATFDHFRETFFRPQGMDTDTVKIGVLEPQTGNDSKHGEMEIRGIELARDLEPKVLGKKVELVYADTQSSIYTAESAVADLIDKKPAVVLGSYGEAVSLTASQQLGAAGVPAISVTAANTLITANNDYYFRVTFSDSSQGSALAQYTVDKLKRNTAAVVRMRDDDTTRDMINKFSSQMNRLASSNNAVETYVDLDLDQKNYTDAVEKLKASKAKVVFMAVPMTTAEQFFKAAKDAGLRGYTFLECEGVARRRITQASSRVPEVAYCGSRRFFGRDGRRYR